MSEPGACCQGNDVCSPKSTQPRMQPISTQEMSLESMAQFDFFESAQRGLLPRMRQLLFDQGKDVNMRDSEGISALHWAAINNRQEIVEFLIGQGCVVDSLGGVLHASPLHWAVGQGHLGIVVLLLQHGADLAIVDAQGYNVLHVAAQNGHAHIITYLIAKGMDVDCRDAQGRTSLMWTAIKLLPNIDAARVLVSLNASINLVDFDIENTALHFAILSQNLEMIKFLVELGARTDIRNKGNRTCMEYHSHLLEDAPTMGDYRPLGRTISMILPQKPRGGVFSTIQTPAGARKVVVWAPLFFLVVAGLAVSAIPSFAILKFFVYSTLLAFVYIVILLNVPPSIFIKESHFFVGIFYATIACIYLTIFVLFLPVLTQLGSWSFNFSFSVVSFAMFYYYRKAKDLDPGFIVRFSNDSERNQIILKLAQSSSIDRSVFCYTCLIRKPLRSKHCSICNRCVMKMDHHCFVTNNCLGARNHVEFFAFCVCLVVVGVMFLVLTLNYFSLHCQYSPISGIFDVLGMLLWLKSVFFCSPWLCWIALNVTVHLAWISAMVLSQFGQIFLFGYTTNEMANRHRYAHLQGRRISPFNRGLFANWRAFFQRTDWANVYSIDQDILSRRDRDTLSP